MWIPLVLSILPKTLLKWASPQSKSSIKFKTKITNNTKKNKIKCNKQQQTLACTNKCIGVIVFETIAATATAFSGVQHKQYLSFFTINYIRALIWKLHVIPLNTNKCIIIENIHLKSLVLVVVANDQILLRTVIIILTFLMNDFRFKYFYHFVTTTTPNTTTTYNNSTLKTIATLLPANTTTAIHNSSNFRCTYNNNANNNNNNNSNSQQSLIKVFLCCIKQARNEPFLSIFTQKINLLNKQQLILDASELKITEDLCNYGELIGGGIQLQNFNSIKASKQLQCSNVATTVPKSAFTKKITVFIRATVKSDKSVSKLIKCVCDKFIVPVIAHINNCLSPLSELQLTRNFKITQNWIVLRKLPFAAASIVL